MALRENPSIDKFLKRDGIKLSRPELDEPHFSNIIPNMIEIENWFNEMIAVSDEIEIPNSWAQQFIQFVEYWNSIYDDIIRYEPISDKQNSRQRLGQIRNKATALYDFMVTGNDRSGLDLGNQLNRSFFSLYSSILSRRVVSIDSLRSKIDESLEYLRLKQVEIDKIGNAIKEIETESTRIAADKTFESYARIFKSESLEFSSFGFDEDDKLKSNGERKSFYQRKFNLGSAEIWLMVGIMLAVLFVCAIFDGRLNQLLPISTDKNQLIASIFTRVLAITIWIYLVTFSFKQYSINRHLATVNKHRSNALNSYKLFMNTISQSDTNAHNTLMLTVAKAIYDQNSTGYLSGKGQDNFSMIELTKVLGGSEKQG